MFRNLVVLMILAASAHAQTSYVITSKADTLYGKVRILSYDQLARVQIDVDKKKQTIPALQVVTVNFR